VNALRRRATEELVEVVTCGGQLGVNLDDAAEIGIFPGEEQRLGEGIPSRAIDPVEAGQVSRRIDWRQQCDAVCRIGHVEIDARHISKVSAVLVPLVEKVAAIIEPWCRPAWILRELEIEVLIRFCVHAAAEQAEFRDHPAWIFQRVGPGRDSAEGKIRIDERG
jgi:hypothetical protein